MYSERRAFKKANMKNFLTANHILLSNYKDIEDEFMLEINVTDCSEEIKSVIKEAINCDCFLCYKISQHLEERKVLYIYFLCEKNGWNKEFVSFTWVSMIGKTLYYPEPIGRLGLMDIKTKIFDFFDFKGGR